MPPSKIHTVERKMNTLNADTSQTCVSNAETKIFNEEVDNSPNELAGVDYIFVRMEN